MAYAPLFPTTNSEQLVVIAVVQLTKNDQKC